MQISARKPEWLKVRPPGGENYTRIKQLLRLSGLSTVCEEARCPNMAECWGGGTATIMLMGDTCTRGCRFCNVKTGNPRGKLDLQEPEKVASIISTLGLKYIVLTSVDRDDLEDGGSEHFANTVIALKKHQPELLVEVLTPDFNGVQKDIAKVVASCPDVLAHNIETVRALTSKVRDQRCGYDLSLTTLKEFKAQSPETLTKSSIMIGLGEESKEIEETLTDLREARVDIVTLGQYLRPTERHLPVEEFVDPKVFKLYELMARKMGFLYVASGPLVRSSYRAGELFVEGLLREKMQGDASGKN